MHIANHEVVNEPMTDEARRVLGVFEETIPKLNQLEREKLLSFGEGILFMKNACKLL